MSLSKKKLAVAYVCCQCALQVVAAGTGVQKLAHLSSGLIQYCFVNSVFLVS